MRRNWTFSGELTERLKLPGEALGEWKLSITAGRRAVIENHRGLLACTDTMVSVRTGHGSLRLWGTELFIAAMNEKEMLVCGNLERAEWDG